MCLPTTHLNPWASTGLYLYMNRTTLAIMLVLTSSPLALAQDPCAPQRVISPPSIGTDDFGAEVKTNGRQ